MAVEDRVEHFTDGNRRGRVLTNQPEPFLQFRRHGIFEPKQMVRFERAAKTCGFDGRQSMMHVVQKMHIGTEVIAHARD